MIGTIVVNNEGVPIKSTLDNPTTVQYSGLLNNLVDQVLYVQKVSPNFHSMITTILTVLLLGQAYRTHSICMIF